MEQVYAIFAYDDSDWDQHLVLKYITSDLQAGRDFCAKMNALSNQIHEYHSLLNDFFSEYRRQKPAPDDPFQDGEMDISLDSWFQTFKKSEAEYIEKTFSKELVEAAEDSSNALVYCIEPVSYLKIS